MVLRRLTGCDRENGMPMDLSEYAKRRGVSKVAVSKAVASGRLRASVVRDDRGNPKIGDVDLADQEWAEKTRPRVDNRPTKPPPVSEQARKKPSPRAEPRHAPAPAPAPEKHASLVQASTPDYHESRAIREAAEARRAVALAEMAELDAAERRGDLVPVDQARSDVESLLASLRTKVMAIPSRVAQRIAGDQGRRASAIVEELVREALEDMAEIRLGEAEEKA